MKKISKLLVVVLTGVLLNLFSFSTYAEQDPVWEFYQSGFTKYFYQNYSCDNNGSPQFFEGGSQYCKYPYLVKEYYSGMTENSVQLMVRDSKGNYFFAYKNSLVKFDGNVWSVFNSDNSNFKGSGENYTYNVTEMKVDSDDNVWMSTYENGLMKFDGTSITIYDNNNSTIPEGLVTDLEIDSLQNLWLAIYEVGLVMFDRNSTFNVYDSNNTNIPNNNFHHLSIDGKGKIWVTNPNKDEFGIAKFDGINSWTLYDVDNSNIADNDVNKISSDNNGNIWVLSSRYSSHVSVMDIDKDSISDHSDKYFTESLYGGGVNLAGDKNGNMYFTGSLGLTRVNISTLDFDHFGGGMYDDAYNLYVDDSNDVYFRKYDGVYTIDNENDTLIFSKEYSEIKNMTSNLTFDNSGNLWGISYGNLVKFDGSDWTKYDFPFHITSMNPSSIKEFVIKSNDEIWMLYGGYIEGLAIFDGTDWTDIDSLPLAQVKDLAKDNNDNIWLSSWGNGIAKLVGTTWTIYDKSNSSLPNDWIHAFTSDKQGNVWMDCFDGPMKEHNMVKFDGTTWTIFDSSSTNGLIGEEEIEVISSDNNGNMYFAYRIGNDDIGFIKYDGSTWSYFSSQNSDLPDNYIEDIASDDNGNLWVCSYGWIIGEGGKWHLSKYNGTSFTKYDTELLGMSKYGINSILPDGAGNVWMINDKRLVKFNDGELNVVSGKLYYDENNDCVEDSTETGMSGIRIKLIDSTDPQNEIITTTDAEGYYFFNPIEGSYYVNPQIGDNWTTTTDNSSPIIINIANPSGSLDFCIKESTEAHDFSIHITSNRARCFEHTNMWVHYENLGTTVSSGTVRLQLDSSNVFVSSVPSPDSNVNGLLSWSYTGLNPYKQDYIKLVVKMPDFNAMGDTLLHIAEIEDDNHLLNSNPNYIYYASDSIESILRCSYDPNDKQVDEGVMTEKYVLFGEELTYTIRFQNTGNDTAFIVVVKDTLDIVNLDTNSFKFISSSHKVRVELDKKTGLAVFTFNNIMLVDSTTDEQGSQGFLKFSVRTKDVLAEKTEIKNKAYIFFDFNPPILTNEVLNTMVSVIPSKQAQIVNTEMMNYNKVFVYPNPVKDISYIKIDNEENQEFNLEIYDIPGKLYKYEAFSGNRIKIDKQDLNSGMYMYKLSSINKTYYGKFIVK